MIIAFGKLSNFPPHEYDYDIKTKIYLTKITIKLPEHVFNMGFMPRQDIIRVQ